jgi:hypothetical protein
LPPNFITRGALAGRAAAKNRVSNNSKLDFASHVLGGWTGLVKPERRRRDLAKPH